MEEASAQVKPSLTPFNRAIRGVLPVNPEDHSKFMDGLYEQHSDYDVNEEYEEIDNETKINEEEGYYWIL